MFRAGVFVSKRASDGEPVLDRTNRACAKAAHLAASRAERFA
jgi:hypothetical protein